MQPPAAVNRRCPSLGQPFAVLPEGTVFGCMLGILRHDEMRRLLRQRAPVGDCLEAEGEASTGRIGLWRGLIIETGLIIPAGYDQPDGGRCGQRHRQSGGCHEPLTDGSRSTGHADVGAVHAQRDTDCRGE